MEGAAATQTGQIHGRIVTKLKTGSVMRVFVIIDFVMRVLVWVLSMEFRCMSVPLCLLLREENIADYIYRCRIYQSTKENLSSHSNATIKLFTSPITSIHSRCFVSALLLGQWQ
jgi:hypothetical protein